MKKVSIIFITLTILTMILLTFANAEARERRMKPLTQAEITRQYHYDIVKLHNPSARLPESWNKRGERERLKNYYRHNHKRRNR